MIRPDAFNGPERTWSKARTRPIGDAKIHRHADQRNVEICKVFLERKIQKGRNAGVWQTALSGALEQHLEQFSPGGIARFVRRRTGVPGTQAFKFVLVHPSLHTTPAG